MVWRISPSVGLCSVITHYYSSNLVPSFLTALSRRWLSQGGHSYGLEIHASWLPRCGGYHRQSGHIYRLEKSLDLYSYHHPLHIIPYNGNLYPTINLAGWNRIKRSKPSFDVIVDDTTSSRHCTLQCTYQRCYSIHRLRTWPTVHW
jgi:hypothetical protein